MRAGNGQAVVAVAMVDAGGVARGGPKPNAVLMRALKA